MSAYAWKKFSVTLKMPPLMRLFRDLPLDERINRRAGEQRVRQWVRSQPNVTALRAGGP